MRQTTGSYAAMNQGTYNPYDELFEDPNGNIVNGLGKIVQYAKDRRRVVHTTRPAATPTVRHGAYPARGATIKKPAAYHTAHATGYNAYPATEDYPKATNPVPTTNKTPVHTPQAKVSTGNTKLDKAIEEKRFILYSGSDSKITSAIGLSGIQVVDEADILTLPQNTLGIVKGLPLTKIPASVKAIVDDNTDDLVVKDESYNRIDAILTKVFNSSGDVITIKSFLKDFTKLRDLSKNSTYSDLLQVKVFGILANILIENTELPNLYLAVRLPKEVNSELMMSNIGIRPAYIKSSKLKTFIDKLGLKNIILIGDIYSAEVFYSTIRLVTVNPLSEDDKESIKDILGE